MRSPGRTLADVDALAADERPLVEPGSSTEVAAVGATHETVHDAGSRAAVLEPRGRPRSAAADGDAQCVDREDLAGVDTADDGERRAVLYCGALGTTVITRIGGAIVFTSPVDHELSGRQRREQEEEETTAGSTRECSECSARSARSALGALGATSGTLAPASVAATREAAR
jgi:hypothetical protein